MEKLTNELVAEWIARNQRFEMRGDGGGLYLGFRADQKSHVWLFRFRPFGEQYKLHWETTQPFRMKPREA